jgi:hypothetical protein
MTTNTAVKRVAIRGVVLAVALGLGGCAVETLSEEPAVSEDSASTEGALPTPPELQESSGIDQLARAPSVSLSLSGGSPRKVYAHAKYLTPYGPVQHGVYDYVNKMWLKPLKDKTASSSGTIDAYYSVCWSSTGTAAVVAVYDYATGQWGVSSAFAVPQCLL